MLTVKKLQLKIDDKLEEIRDLQAGIEHLQNECEHESAHKEDVWWICDKCELAMIGFKESED